MSEPSGRSSPPSDGGASAEVSVDVRERGANQQHSTRRLFLQLQVFGECGESKPLAAGLEASRLDGVLYADVNDPRGVGVLGLSEDPTLFVTGFRELLGSEPFVGLARKPELTMLGRTYASGFET